MEARNRTLPDWLTRVRTRQIKLPRFQRFEAWTHTTVTGLLNTVLQGLPAGAVLVLEIGDVEPFASRVVVGAPEEGERVIEHLLDGQQRITALWRSLTDNYSDRSYYICVRADEETNATAFATSHARWMKEGRRFPLWLEEPVKLWEQRLIPVHLLRPDSAAENELTAWAMIASGGDMNITLEIVKTANSLRGSFAQFNIPFLSLPATTPKETALNVFIQMNTSATPLSNYDIVVAQVEAVTGQSLHDLVADIRVAVPDVDSYIDVSDLMLSVSALLQDKTPTKNSFLSQGFSDKLVETWESTKHGIRKAISFLSQEQIFDSKRLPTDVVLAPLAALWAIAPDRADAAGEARLILRKYLWRACFTERYERTSATRALADFRDLRDLIKGSASTAPALFNDSEYPLPAVEELINAGWPTKKDRLPRAIVALSLLQGAYDFADGSPITRESLHKREYHHLFPVASLRSHGSDDSHIFRALNCALITDTTNRIIGAKYPETYLADRSDGSTLGHDEIDRRLKSHLIPVEYMALDNYENFLEARAAMMHEFMVNVCSGASI
jgi:hypothetical protein